MRRSRRLDCADRRQRSGRRPRGDDGGAGNGDSCHRPGSGRFCHGGRAHPGSGGVRRRHGHARAGPGSGPAGRWGGGGSPGLWRGSGHHCRTGQCGGARGVGGDGSSLAGPRSRTLARDSGTCPRARPARLPPGFGHRLLPELLLRSDLFTGPDLPGRSPQREPAPEDRGTGVGTRPGGHPVGHRHRGGWGALPG